MAYFPYKAGLSKHYPHWSPILGLALATSLAARPVLAESPTDRPAAERGNTMYSLIFTCLLTLCLLPASALAEPPAAATIIKQMKTAFEPAQPTVRTLSVNVYADNETLTWQVGQVFKPSAAGNQMLTVVLEPAELKGNVFLVREQGDGSSVMWTYSPTIRRVREIVPVDAYERFMGTDFTYADLDLVRLHEHYQFLGEEQHDKVPAYLIEESPEGQREYYSRILIWVAKDSLLPLEREYYDRAGELWKRERFEHAVEVDGVPIPLRISMQDVQAKTRTTLTVKEVRTDVQVPDDVFEPKKMPTVASHLVWQTHPAADSKEQ